MTNTYAVGDIIEYQPFGGGVRKIVVTAREADIKNGRPGFDGYVLGAPDMSVWGYDDQIILTIEPLALTR